jgi:hypothetical protein
MGFLEVFFKINVEGIPDWPPIFSQKITTQVMGTGTSYLVYSQYNNGTKRVADSGWDPVPF